MPEGDTIAYAAARMRPVLEGAVPDRILTPQARHRYDRWPERLDGRAVSEVRTHGKHLFIVFEGDLLIHSHLRMTGSGASTLPAVAGSARAAAGVAGAPRPRPRGGRSSTGPCSS